MMTAFCPFPFPSSKRLRAYTTPKCALSSSENVKRSKADPTLTEFNSWAEENGVEMNSIKLTSLASDSVAVLSRGMVATTPLKTGDLLVSLNRNRALQVTSLDGKRSPFPEKVSNETWRKLPWYVRLALRTLDCRTDNRNELHVWASLLPTSLELPLCWSDDELTELQNPRIIQAVREQRKEYKKWYDMLNSANNAVMRGVKYGDFLWAVNCVRSRAFQGPLELASFKERLRLIVFIASNVVIWPALNTLPLENALNGGLTALFALFLYDVLTPKVVKTIQGVELQRYAMTPGIDFFNHNSRVTERAQVSFEYFADRFQVRSGEDYQPGDEVFISYGSQSNDTFLQYYGFIEPDNPAETFTFDSSVEQMLGVSPKSLVAKRNGFDKRVVDAVTRKLDGNRKAAETTLRELCQAELNAMATTLDEDEALMQKVPFESPRRELAIRYRIEKKRLLSRIANLGKD
ncbi:Rubisco LSMT substrate-binding protein [Gracilaria domingensis]|nr:Rubisco LSMT substrate-binding protein [Gracilaria domingensis]